MSPWIRSRHHSTTFRNICTRLHTFSKKCAKQLCFEKWRCTALLFDFLHFFLNIFCVNCHLFLVNVSWCRWRVCTVGERGGEDRCSCWYRHLGQRCLCPCCATQKILLYLLLWGNFLWLQLPEPPFPSPVSSSFLLVVSCFYPMLFFRWSHFAKKPTALFFFTDRENFTNCIAAKVSISVLALPSSIMSPMMPKEP